MTENGFTGRVSDPPSAKQVEALPVATVEGGNPLGNLSELVKRLEVRGVKLTGEGTQLRVKPWGDVTEPERNRLRANKAAILKLLGAEAEEVAIEAPKPKRRVKRPVAAHSDRPMPMPTAEHDHLRRERFYWGMRFADQIERARGR